MATNSGCKMSALTTAILTVLPVCTYAAQLIPRLDSNSFWGISANPNATGWVEEGWLGPGYAGIENQARYRYVSGEILDSVSYGAVRIDYDTRSVRMYAMGGAGEDGFWGADAFARLGGQFVIVPEPHETIGQQVRLYLRTTAKYLGPIVANQVGFSTNNTNGAEYLDLPIGSDVNLSLSAYARRLPNEPAVRAVSVLYELTFEPSDAVVPNPFHPRTFADARVNAGDIFFPNSSETGVMQFSQARSGGWFDPPLANGFVYTMQSASLFTSVDDFPGGFGDAFAVSVGTVTLPVTFAAGDVLDFSDWASTLGDLLINGNGVQSFRLTGISPAVDPGDPLAFPLRLSFDTEFADFTMTAVPEPTSFVLLAVSSFALIFNSSKRRRLADLVA